MRAVRVLRRIAVAVGACLLFATACSEGTGPEEDPPFTLVVENVTIAPSVPEASVVYDSGRLIVLGTTFTCEGAFLTAVVKLTGMDLTVRLEKRIGAGGCLDVRKAVSFRVTIEDLRPGRYHLRVIELDESGGAEPTILIDQPIFIPAGLAGSVADGPSTARQPNVATKSGLSR